jgi:hypothetical protein
MLAEGTFRKRWALRALTESSHRSLFVLRKTYMGVGKPEVEPDYDWEALHGVVPNRDKRNGFR